MHKFTANGQKGPGCTIQDLGSADEITCSRSIDDPHDVVVIGHDAAGNFLFRHVLGSGQVKVTIQAVERTES